MTTLPKAKVQDIAEQLLQTDCAMIAQNKSHIVVALRLSRQSLAANHDMLLCLSEAACGSPLPPPKPRPSALPKPLNSILAITSGIGAALLAWGILGTAVTIARATDPPPPIACAPVPQEALPYI